MFETSDSPVSDWGLVQGGQNAEGVDEIGHFFRAIGIFFEFENAICDFEEKVIVVVHLFDDFDEVGDELIPDSVMAWVRRGVPRTAPMTAILEAALILRDGLSLLSYSM